MLLTNATRRPIIDVPRYTSETNYDKNLKMKL